MPAFKDDPTMKHLLRSIKLAWMMALAVAFMGLAFPAQAGTLPVASSSLLAGIEFDDPPFALPVERNFQMALLSVSGELGRSCGKMEAFGWRMNKREQGRVNGIFKNTVDKLRSEGYAVTPGALKGGSKDVTLFTADRSNRHLLFLWSAGDTGLVLNLCESSAPLAPTHSPKSIGPAIEVFPLLGDVSPATRGTFGTPKSGVDPDKFTPIGRWVGGYSCAQGYTGGTLRIKSFRGQDFEGVFEFYPTGKNLSVARGSYNVYGQYDRDSKRVLINPGKWIRRPKGFFDTVIVGSFDPYRDTFSGFFQGIEGCTSFEAHRAGPAPEQKAVKKKTSKKKAPAKKKAKQAEPVSEMKKEAPTDTLAIDTAPLTEGKKDPGIFLDPSAAHPVSDAPIAPALQEPVPLPPAPNK